MTVRDRVREAGRRSSWHGVLVWCTSLLAPNIGGCQLIMDEIVREREAGVTGPEDGGLDGEASISASDDAASDGPAHDATEPDAPADGGALELDAERDALEPDAERDAHIESGAPQPDPEACDGAGQRTFYRDSDKDGYGDPSTTTIACEAPSEYVENDDDCSDGNADAHPGQTQFFATGYSVPGASVRSFDYDCDTNERGEPGLAQHEACSSGLLGCTGNGYKQDSNRANMSDVNPYCGSDVFVQCGASGLLACGPMPVVNGQPFACN